MAVGSAGRRALEVFDVGVGCRGGSGEKPLTAKFAKKWREVRKEKL
jgi:hypothetical protein